MHLHKIFKLCLSTALAYFLFSFLLSTLTGKAEENNYKSVSSLRDYCSIFLPTIANQATNFVVLTNNWEIETNDYFTKANEMSLNKTYLGTADWSDVYAFRITTTTSISVSAINHDIPYGQLVIYGEDTWTVISYVVTPPDHYIMIPSLSPGLYYSVLGTTATVPLPYPTYTLQISTPDLPPPNITDFYRIQFLGEHIVSNNHITLPNQTQEIPTFIPSGNYKVRLGSSDNHPNSPNQNEEQWYLAFYDADRKFITRTNPTEDLPNNKDCQFDIVNDRLTLTETAAFVRGIHAAYPTNKDEPNSVYPEFAILEEVK